MGELVVIFIGSKSDSGHSKKVAGALHSFGVASQVRVASAHKATGHLLELIRQYDASGKRLVYVAVAGRSNALGGVIDGNSLNPVINCPPYSEKFKGLDVLSSLRMPSGMASTTILGPENCALACVKIFSLHNKSLRKKLAAYKKQMRKKAGG